MTDNEIIKALRCCADRYCKGCSEKGKANCRESVAALAWDLIYRQKSEIERLKKALDTDFSFVGTRCSGKTKRATEIIKFRVETIKAEAVKEFAERLKEKKFELDDQNEGIFYVVEVEDIDNLVKEMVGEQQ